MNQELKITGLAHGQSLTAGREGLGCDYDHRLLSPRGARVETAPVMGRTEVEPLEVLAA